MDYEQLVTAIDSASQALLGRAAKAVNQALVVRNWLIGAHLLEFEQKRPRSRNIRRAVTFKFVG